MEEPLSPPEEKKLPAPEEKLLRPPTFWERDGRLLRALSPLFLILILIAVFLYINKTPKTIQNSQLPAPTQSLPTSLPTPTTNPTANWKTYEDTKLGYTVKYPPGYELWKYTHTPQCLSRQEDKNGTDVIFLNSDFNKNHDISINRIVDFDIIIDDPNDKCMSPHYSGGGEFGYGPKLLKTENIKINTYNVLKRTYQDTPPPKEIVGDRSDEEYAKYYKAFIFSTYRFENKGKYYTLIINNGIGVDPQPQEKLFQTFLSTFKFLDQTADTSNWKTYKAKDYDFEVKYPSDWFILPFSSTVENVHIPLVIANAKLEGREFPKENQIKVNFYVFEDKFDNLDAFAKKNGLSPLDVEQKVEEQNDLIGKYLTEEARITTEDIVVNQGNTYLNDNQAIKQEIECKKYCTFLDSKGLEISYYILHNNTFYKIWAELPSRDSTLITIYEKILSTFKFTQ